MTNLATVFARIPKFVLFGAAGLIQIALTGLMVIDRVAILRTGAAVTLQTRPLDPRDFLRGDYVVLDYDISSLPAGALKDERSAGQGTPVFVKLAPNRDGFHEAISVHAAPVDVASPEVLIRGHVVGGANCGRDLRTFCSTLLVACVS
jgi:GDYXXLXY protein